MIARRAALELAPGRGLQPGIGGLHRHRQHRRRRGYPGADRADQRAGTDRRRPLRGCRGGDQLHLDHRPALPVRFLRRRRARPGLPLVRPGGPPGSVNVSRFNGRIIGVGGFINISQNAKKVIFSGTFTAGGLDIVWEDGQTVIRKRGNSTSSIAALEQVSYSGPFAQERGQEACTSPNGLSSGAGRGGLELIEIAPGSRPGAGCPGADGISVPGHLASS